MIVHLRITGVMFLAIGLAHAAFAKHLDWKRDAAKLTLVNRQVFHVHGFYIALLMVMLGLLSLFEADALLQSGPLSRAVLGGMTVLWTVRLYIQWFVFDHSLWRENRFNRTVHYLLTLFWIYVAAVDGTAFSLVLH